MFLGILLPPEVVIKIYHWALFPFITVISSYMIGRGGDGVLRPSKWSLPVAALLCVFVGFVSQQIVAFGALRDEYGGSDLGLYYLAYQGLTPDSQGVDWTTEWGWNVIITICRSLGFSVWDWFMLIRVVYIGGMLMTCWIAMRGKEWIAILFFVYAFSFIGYGANGLRIGFATSLVCITIVMPAKKMLWQMLAIILMVSAVSVHKSMMLPVAMVLISWVSNISTKLTIIIWLMSILISLVAGNTIGDFFASLGFDDRLSEYISEQDNKELMEYFAYTGFRWDFLLYSAAPILWVWYLTIKRDFKDRMFNLIANTYILSNAFWVMVIRAAYSNRFAYLSWFLYPLVLAYPLLRFKIWENQDRKVGLILLAYASFTFLMYIRG